MSTKTEKLVEQITNLEKQLTETSDIPEKDFIEVQLVKLRRELIIANAAMNVNESKQLLKG